MLRCCCVNNCIKTYFARGAEDQVYRILGDGIWTFDSDIQYPYGAIETDYYELRDWPNAVGVVSPTLSSATPLQSTFGGYRLNPAAFLLGGNPTTSAGNYPKLSWSDTYIKADWPVPQQFNGYALDLADAELTLNFGAEDVPPSCARSNSLARVLVDDTYETPALYSSVDIELTFDGVLMSSASTHDYYLDTFNTVGSNVEMYNSELGLTGISYSSLRPMLDISPVHDIVKFAWNTAELFPTEENPPLSTPWFPNQITLTSYAVDQLDTEFANGTATIDWSGSQLSTENGKPISRSSETWEIIGSPEQVPQPDDFFNVSDPKMASAKTIVPLATYTANGGSAFYSTQLCDLDPKDAVSVVTGWDSIATVKFTVTFTPPVGSIGVTHLFTPGHVKKKGNNVSNIYYFRGNGTLTGTSSDWRDPATAASLSLDMLRPDWTFYDDFNNPGPFYKTPPGTVGISRVSP